MAGPAKKCDNLLVNTEYFHHFRGLLLCNAKYLQFHHNKKQEHMGTVKQVFYPPIFPFFLIDGVVGSVRVT